ncbi:MAG: multidrug efflux SMR transporter [Sphingomonadaceae bacterium]
MQPWILLAGAILLELTGTALLKLSDGFRNPAFGVGALALYGVSFWLLALTLRHIPVGVAYAIWSGIGIFGITLLGRFAFGQSLSWAQGGFIALIVVGVIGLQIVTAQQPAHPPASNHKPGV